MPIDQQDFWNLFWLMMWGISLIPVIGISYGFGYRRGWRSCDAVAKRRGVA